MRILFSWLRELLEISLHPEALAELLTLAGCEVTGVTKIDGDWLLGLEVTPNRPDLLSHLGVAREAAALLGRPFRLPRWLRREFLLDRGLQGEQQKQGLPITIEDTQGCRRYVGICIDGITVRPSPPLLAQRLTRLGIRPVNNVVDATNACLMELGQPLHPFDRDTLEGPQIRVRRAFPKESLVMIDGVSRELTSGHLVIADQRRPVALAGVMGGRDTEIKPTTRRILLESAWFDPALIRRAVRSLRLSSESSYRFERGVDPLFVRLAASRAARLIVKLAGGKIAADPMDVGDKEIPRRSIRLSPSRAQLVLGMRIYPAQQRRLLERLGCQVTGTTRGFHVKPPSHRGDLRIPEDLYEELARLWGYERCPATLAPLCRMKVTSQRKPLEDPRFFLKGQLRGFLAAAGCQEIITYSLIGPELLQRCRLQGPGSLAIENPLTNEQALMRPSLLPGALEVLARNIHRKSAPSFQFFELGNVYRQGPLERLALGLLFAGTPAPRWGVPPKPLGLSHVKGVVESLCRHLRVRALAESVEPGPGFLGTPSLAFRLKPGTLGWAGHVDPRVLASFDLPEGLGVIFAELDLESLATQTPLPLKVQPLPKVPPIDRDLAILLSQETSYEAVLRLVEEAGQPLLKRVTLFDLYQGPQVPPGKKSLGLRLTFFKGDRSLTDEEIASAHQRIVDSLKDKLQASLR